MHVSNYACACLTLCAARIILHPMNRAAVVAGKNQVLVMRESAVLAAWFVGVRAYNGRGKPMSRECCIALATEYAAELNAIAGAEAYAAQINGAE